MGKIPKIIHYCWFGRKPMDDKVKTYIDSWKKQCSDYRIIEWNEDNFDIDNSCEYVKQAYAARKWAFVADYVRLFALYEMGGIYLDTDVEILRPYDEMLDNDFFIGAESRYSLCTATIGAVKNSPLIKSLLDNYDVKKFLLSDGRYDTTPNSQGIYEFFKAAYHYSFSQEVFSTDAITIYPQEYFSPINCYTLKSNVTENTYSIHHYEGSWKTDREKRKEKIKSYITRLIGEDTRQKLKSSIKR